MTPQAEENVLAQLCCKFVGAEVQTRVEPGLCTGNAD